MRRLGYGQIFSIIVIISFLNFGFLFVLLERTEKIINKKTPGIVRKPHNVSNEKKEVHIPLKIDKFDAKRYEEYRSRALKPFTNVTTVAYPHGPFGGFRNQYMTFSGIMLMMQSANHSQIIVESIKWKDLFGTNERLRHDLFFDVVHWNSFYPILPRFVEFDAAIYNDVQFIGKTDTSPSIRWNVKDLMQATNPYGLAERGLVAQNQYKQYVKKVVEGVQQRNLIDLYMLKGAFRPHPALQNIIEDFLKSDGVPVKYMVLHARIEPDMQKHTMCLDKKITNLTEIINLLEKKFPEPPVNKVLIILNRGILEKEVATEDIDNELADYNLKVLNSVIRNGLWDGRAKAIEAGVELAKNSGHPIYSKYYSLAGSVIDFFLAVQSDIFVGTEVSSFSVDVEITRFYRDRKENYHYLPNKLEPTTLANKTLPPRFKC
mmetsp:Transcript_7902/g.10047  ORF Transcript_7902/g.10047 Transcript_7902/m.10047 type:complete len:432 (+) Transcript_7902:310-1605(+)